MKWRSLTIKELLDLARNRESGKCRYEPYRDWQRLVMIFIAIFWLVLGVHYYFYRIYAEGHLIVPETEQELISRRRLEEAVNLITVKEVQFEHLFTAPTTVADPSR